MADRIQLRRDTAANWTSVNPAWPAGTRIELRLTSGTMTRIASRAVDGGFAAASYGTIQEINGGSANG